MVRTLINFFHAAKLDLQSAVQLTLGANEFTPIVMERRVQSEELSGYAYVSKVAVSTTSLD